MPGARKMAAKKTKTKKEDKDKKTPLKEKVPFEDTPYLLWDRGEKVEVQMLKNPEIAKKIIDYSNSLIKLSKEKFIPNLSKS